MNNIKFLYYEAVKKFHSWKGLMFSLFITIFLLLYLFRFIPEDFKSPKIIAAGVGLPVFLLLVYWAVHVWYYPKPSDNKVGVVIAVKTESLEDRKLLKDDFVSGLKKRIEHFDLPIDTVVLKKHQADKIESLDDAKSVLSKTQSQFCLWGSIKKRRRTNGQRYIFSLYGAVVHKPVDDAKKTKLEKEFQKVLPQRKQNKSELQFELFVDRSDDSFNAINYIVGIAALLSLDVDMAIQLHEPLFDAVEESGNGITIEAEELKVILSIEYGLKMRIALKEKNKEAYRSATKKAVRFRPDEYSRLIMESIVEFDLGDGNPEKSLEIINEASDLPRAKRDKTHLYNKTFLNFWLENYQVAVANYEQLKNVSYDGEIDAAEQVVRFCDLVIDNKNQLHFLMGFIYLNKLDNPTMAYKHFKKFSENHSSSIESLRRRAESYIEKLEKYFDESS